MDYSKTVSLPQTSFPMRGNLSEKEPEIMRLWDEKEVYKKIQEKNKGNASYILHDGPPYANGQIHLGTALNKILKDVVVKYRSLRGFYSPYKPGWDCHGMPIEHQVFTNEKKHKNEVDVSIFRKKTAAYAKKFVEIQKKGSGGLGFSVIGNIRILPSPLTMKRLSSGHSATLRLTDISIRDINRYTGVSPAKQRWRRRR